MGFSHIRLFSFKNYRKVAQYSLGSILINRLPKGLKNTYDFIHRLKRRGITFKKVPEGILFQYPINGNQLSFLMGENTSDSDVFEQIVIKEEYSSVVELFLKRNWKINTLIDAGANVGYTSMYLKQFFPEMKIIALEPNQNTLGRLAYNINTNALSSCTLLNIGLWSKAAYLKPDLSFRDGQDWSFRLIETLDPKEKLIEVISIDELLQRNQWGSVDFLKIDIEGGEDEIFNMLIPFYAPRK